MIISGKIQLKNNESSQEVKEIITEAYDSLIEEFDKEIESNENVEWVTKNSRKGLAPGISELLLFACTFSSGIATGVIANYITKFLDKKFSKKEKDIKTENNKIVIILEEAKIIIEIQEDN